MEIENVEIYGLNESIRAAKFPMSTDTLRLNTGITDGIRKLAQSAIGAGHDNWLNGVVVQFDATAPNKWWTEAQRYHFLDFVSSQSTMHRIAQFDLKSSYDEHTDPRMVEIMEELVRRYNETKEEEDYLCVLYSNPCGMLLTARMTTNYRQLKTIYRQRRFHRLPDWRVFCGWVESLPMSELITGEQKGEHNEY